MPDTSTNNELLTKILERLDQLDKKFIGEIQSVRGEVQAVGKRVDQLDEKFTGEIQSVRGEIQAARKESRDFYGAYKESTGHLTRAIDQVGLKASAFEQKMDRRWEEQQRIWLEIWDNIRRAMEKDDKRTLNYEKALARVNEEIEELKRDKAVKEAIIQDLQQRLIKLETAQNISN